MNALEQIAYDIIEARASEDLDEDEECEWFAHSVSVREKYLRHQAKILCEVWQMVADSFSPDSIADFVISLELVDQ